MEREATVAPHRWCFISNTEGSSWWKGYFHSRLIFQLAPPVALSYYITWFVDVIGWSKPTIDGDRQMVRPITCQIFFFFRNVPALFRTVSKRRLPKLLRLTNHLAHLQKQTVNTTPTQHNQKVQINLSIPLESSVNIWLFSPICYKICQWTFCIYILFTFFFQLGRYIHEKRFLNMLITKKFLIWAILCSQNMFAQLRIGRDNVAHTPVATCVNSTSTLQKKKVYMRKLLSSYSVVKMLFWKHCFA